MGENDYKVEISKELLEQLMKRKSQPNPVTPVDWAPIAKVISDLYRALRAQKLPRYIIKDLLTTTWLALIHN